MKLTNIYATGFWTGEYEEGFFLSLTGQSLPELEDAIANLSAEEISGPIITSHGTYIVKVYEKVSERVYTLDVMRDEIRGSLNNQLKKDEIDRIIEQWLSEANITKYENRL